jgi:hypothetical protein
LWAELNGPHYLELENFEIQIRLLNSNNLSCHLKLVINLMIQIRDMECHRWLIVKSNVLPKVWIQFTGLPSHLQDYLIIWAVGSIMGVAKEVDMEFTRLHGISRIQVMVMNPNLIPQAVNIVIGDGLYKLKFRVEMNDKGGIPHPMDVDHNLEGDGFGRRDEQDMNNSRKQIILGSKSGASG